jgi:hypothetical protein
LVRQLGYDADGRHPQDRRLVFVGDLGDRGPDSPRVLSWVQGLVEAGRAQCVLGNHELNLLRGEPKAGNRWFLDPGHPEHRGEFRHSACASPAQRARCQEFLERLPLALERADLRVVHAAWHAPSIEQLRRIDGPVMPVFRRFEDELRRRLKDGALGEAADAEREAYAAALVDPLARVPLLRHVARLEELEQGWNPVRVVTSGMERAVEAPFWASGKWRMCERVRWWESYDDTVPVVVGHYWRKLGGSGVDGQGEDLFEGHAPNAWVGGRRNVFCVDFSIGARYRERSIGARAFSTRLAAVRWPEKTLVLDDGETRPLA